jgi:formate dehydrogenase accessory protein FdhE
MKESWDARIERARYLASKNGAAQELLVFYGQLLRVQKEIYEYLSLRRDCLPTGTLEEDLPGIREMLPELLRRVEASGPPALSEQAQTLLRAGDAELDEMLLEQWRAPLDIQFFAKAFLQPYARWLAESGASLVGRVREGRAARCPFCAGKPQLSTLQNVEAAPESGGRSLMCSTCLSVWAFRRVVCANCGEERPSQVGYFHSPEYDHIRIEACDTCQHYTKGIDLTRLGLAVPLVDEVAAAPLDLWAREHGYQKIELNLVGL